MAKHRPQIWHILLVSLAQKNLATLARPQDVWYSLMTCRLPTAACLSGHAIAGGALLATVVDYKVMVDSPKLSIGLNEAKFGMVAPPFLMDSFRGLVGHRRAGEDEKDVASHDHE